MNGFETILPFLKPIEHLILDDSISEVMVNGPDRVFFERKAFIEHASGISLGERSLTVTVKNIARRLGDDISEAKPILDSRLPDGSCCVAVVIPSLQPSAASHSPFASSMLVASNWKISSVPRHSIAILRMCSKILCSGAATSY